MIEPAGVEGSHSVDPPAPRCSVGISSGPRTPEAVSLRAWPYLRLGLSRATAMSCREIYRERPLCALSQGTLSVLVFCSSYLSWGAACVTLLCHLVYRGADDDMMTPGFGYPVSPDTAPGSLQLQQDRDADIRKAVWQGAWQGLGQRPEHSTDRCLVWPRGSSKHPSAVIPHWPQGASFFPVTSALEQ